MNVLSTKTRERVHLVLFLLFFVLTVFLNLTCSEDDNPASDPACGSGRVYWDEKPAVCRDKADGHVVPNSCCGL